MIENRILDGIDQVINTATEIFEKKHQDYGSAWREMRIVSLADQVYIKATRITQILDGGQLVNGPGDDIGSEFLGIFNYSLMGLVQNKIRNMPETFEEPPEIALAYFSESMMEFKKYVWQYHQYALGEILNWNLRYLANEQFLKTNRLKKITERYKEIPELIAGSFKDVALCAVIGHMILKT